MKRLHRLRRPAFLGTLRSVRPLSDHLGYDRGTPLDRYYIEQFLAAERRSIHGRVLEIKDSGYIDRFGTGVTHREILDIDRNNPLASVVDDLAIAGSLSSNSFDCFILTQTLQYIYDVRAAVLQANRILMPGGVLLVTVPSVSRTTHGHDLQRDYWRFTADSCARLFGEVFDPQQVTVRSFGNLLTSIAFLSGMAHEEMSRRELDFHDERFPLIIGIRAIKTR